MAVGTMQYDANLPERFDLVYTGEDGKDRRPVMLHRAVLGTVERFLSVYIEHCGGDFPAWLAPAQAIVLTVSDKSSAYAREVAARLRARGLRIDVDLDDDRLGAKIRHAHAYRYPYMIIVGTKDAEERTVSIRSRDRGDLGQLALDEFVTQLAAESVIPTGCAGASLSA